MPTTANTPPPGTPAATPAHMTGAELQTLREAAGLSREALAERVGVQARTVKHWEGGRAGVPADVASAAQTLAAWVRTTAQHIENDAREWLRRFSYITVKRVKNREPGALEITPAPPLVLLRYQDTAHIHPADRSAGAPAELQGAAVVQVVQRLAWDGIPARVVRFDPAAFATWRSAQQLDDTPDTRQAWAEREALPAQAIPPRGDQPPPDFAPGYGTPSTGTARTRSRP